MNSNDDTIKEKSNSSHMEMSDIGLSPMLPREDEKQKHQQTSEESLFAIVIKQSELISKL